MVSTGLWNHLREVYQWDPPLFTSLTEGKNLSPLTLCNSFVGTFTLSVLKYLDFFFGFENVSALIQSLILFKKFGRESPIFNL